MSKIKINRTNHDKAREYFGILGNLEYDLHHIDKDLINKDPERYNEWKPEDLIVLTHSEHSKLHLQDKNEDFGCAPKGERNGANTHPEKNIFVQGSKKVRCIETGKVFDTVRDANKWLGLSEKSNGSTIVACCKGKRKTSGGYHWEYAS